jgi:hypothetical protein
MGSCFLALYIMYMITLNEMKAILEVSAQVGQSGPVNKTSVKSIAQGDSIREVKRHERRISNDTSQTVKKSTKPAQKSAAIKLPAKAALSHNFFAPLRTTDKDMETTGAENYRSRRSPENRVGCH